MHFPLLKNCGITMFMIKKPSKAYIKRFLRMTKALRFSCVMKKAIIADSAMAAFSRHSGCPVRPAIWPVLSRMKSIGEWDMAGLWWTM